MSNSIQYLDLPSIYGAIQQFQGNQQKSRLLELQQQMEQTKFQRGEEAYKAQQALLNGIADPRQRLAATIAPDQFAKSIFRDPKDNYSTSESGLWDFSGGTPKFTPNPNAGVGVAPLPGMQQPSDQAPLSRSPSANLQNAAPPQPGPTPNGGKTIGTGPGKMVAGEVPEIYRPHIEDAAAVYGVDGGVLGRMLLKETAPGGPMVSKAGAKGVMQFMDPTARQYGVDVNDPKGSIDGAGKMMGHLLQKYGGDYRLAVGAYNWGEGNVDQWIKEGGDPAKVPKETMDYVRSIVGIGTAGPDDQSGLDHPGTAKPGGGATAPQAQQYPPGAVGFRKNNKTGEYISGGKAGYGILVDAQGRELGSYRLPGMPDEEGQKQAELTLKQQEARAKEDERRQKLLNDANTEEWKWRDSFKEPIKQATELSTQVGNIREAIKRADGSGDIAAINAYNILLNPGAVVREADVALTLQAQGLGDRLKTWMENKKEGDILPPDLRKSLLAMSESIHATSMAALKDRVVSYRDAIEKNGGDWGRIIPPGMMRRFGWDAETPPPTVQTPQAATTEPPVQGARQADDGNWYVADPARPGKYLQVK